METPYIGKIYKDIHIFKEKKLNFVVDFTFRFTFLASSTELNRFVSEYPKNRCSPSCHLCVGLTPTSDKDEHLSKLVDPG